MSTPQFNFDHSGQNAYVSAVEYKDAKLNSSRHLAINKQYLFLSLVSVA
jgi:hypothetical protein